jgi:hypothetical protein
MKHAYQFRYYDSKNIHGQNYPATINDWSAMINNRLFDYANINGVITHIGIQGRPGVKFRLNGSLDWITIGATGIYELDLSGLSYITSIAFDRNSIEYLENINGNLNKNQMPIEGILIDIIYDGIEVLN